MMVHRRLVEKWGKLNSDCSSCRTPAASFDTRFGPKIKSSLPMAENETNVAMVIDPQLAVVTRDEKEKLRKALARIIECLGAEHARGIQEAWAKVRAGHGKENHAEGDAIVVDLMQKGRSHIEIRSLLGVGGYRLNRLTKRLALGDSFVPPVHHAAHAFSIETKQFLYDHMSSWTLMEAVSCPHQAKRKHFVEKGITWRKLHERYCTALAAFVETEPESKSKIKQMKYSTFTQCVHDKDPSIVLERARKSEKCDICLGIDVTPRTVATLDVCAVASAITPCSEYSTQSACLGGNAEVEQIEGHVEGTNMDFSQSDDLADQDIATLKASTDDAKATELLFSTLEVQHYGDKMHGKVKDGGVRKRKRKATTEATTEACEEAELDDDGVVVMNV